MKFLLTEFPDKVLSTARYKKHKEGWVKYIKNGRYHIFDKWLMIKGRFLVNIHLDIFDSNKGNKHKVIQNSIRLDKEVEKLSSISDKMLNN